MLAALSVALVLGTAGCGEDDEEAEGPSREQVQRALDQAVEAGAPGIAVQLNGPHGNEFLISGSTSLETAEDQFRVASTGESFTAAMVMQLVEEGELSLDDTVRDLGPGLRGVGPTITIRDLLAALDTRTANRLLALVIQEVTGNGYEEELESRILVPLDLAETNLVVESPGAPGVLLSTPDDITTFFEALMAGALIGRDEIELMMSGLGVEGFEVSCGEVWGQTGGPRDPATLGAAKDDGTASVAFMAGPPLSGPAEEDAILHARDLAICRALGEAVD